MDVGKAKANLCLHGAYSVTIIVVRNGIDDLSSNPV